MGALRLGETRNNRMEEKIQDHQFWGFVTVADKTLTEL